MFFSLTFPLEEEVNFSKLDARIKRINRFFRLKANLCGKSRAFGVQLLLPSEDLEKDFSNYYIIFKFFNPHREPQKKLELMYSIGNDKSLYLKLRLDVCTLSFIASLPLNSVTFSHDKHNLNISIDFSDEHQKSVKSYIDMLTNDIKKKEEAAEKKAKEKTKK